jgi:hypothetical protein
VIRLPRHLGAHPESPAAELVRAVDTMITLELAERRTGAELVTETDRERLKRARMRWEGTA